MLLKNAIRSIFREVGNLAYLKLFMSMKNYYASKLVRDFSFEIISILKASCAHFSIYISKLLLQNTKKMASHFVFYLH